MQCLQNARCQALAGPALTCQQHRHARGGGAGKLRPYLLHRLGVADERVQRCVRSRR